MLCKISDLIVEIPEAGGMSSRCQEYLIDGRGKADIVIREENYNLDKWEGASIESAIYLESGFQFYHELLHFDGMMLHASAVALDGKAYLFSGPCGVGKSTHTDLWQAIFGQPAKVFNDDKPALRRLDGRWFAYGTPWCGKNGININMKTPLAGICFLRQSDKNEIRRLSAAEAMPKVIAQTTSRLRDITQMEKMLQNVEKLISEIPIYELCNKPEPEAAWLSFHTMRRGAEEIGL